MTLNNIGSELVKDSPIAGLAAAHFLGLTLSDWTLALGLFYGVVRLGWFGVECYWKWKDRQHGTSN